MWRCPSRKGVVHEPASPSDDRYCPGAGGQGGPHAAAGLHARGRDRRRISFAAAEANTVKPGQGKIGPINRQLISRWRTEMNTSTQIIAPRIP
jgi:hypothetical protein